MSNVQASIKVTDQIIFRVFDQRQFTSGEINYITKEVGEKCDLEKNFDRVLRLNQDVCVISDTYSSELCKFGDKLAKDVCDQVTSLHETTERLLWIEDEQRKKEESWLGKARLEQERKKRDCYRDVNAKLEKLNESLVGEEIELERKYLLFEENLRNKS